MKLILLLACLLPAAALAVELPADGDAWTECMNVSDASAVGWTTTCGLSQSLTVSTDCCVGTGSVGVTATRSYWCNPFQLVRNEALGNALGLGFSHRADHAAWFMDLRVVMEPTPAEAALGCTEKRAVWSYDTVLDWTHEDFWFEEADWQWRVGGMWGDLAGGEPSPTALIMVEWAFCTYFGVEIGDAMLLDGLSFHLGDTGVGPAPGVRLEAPHPNPANPRVQIPVVLDGEGVVGVEVCDLAGRRVAVVHRGPLPAGPSTLAWDGRRDDSGAAAAGVYLVRVTGGGTPQTRRFVLAR